MSKVTTSPQVEEEINRDWHPNYVKYTEMIVSHPNYEGLPFERDKITGRVKWVAAGKSAKGQIRQAWWDKKCAELGIPIQKGCYAIAARAIHPTKLHVCQCCGKELSIYYIYPAKTTIKKLQSAIPAYRALGSIKQSDYSIFDIINQFCKTQGELDFISIMLDLTPGMNKKQLCESIFAKYKDGDDHKRLSPGVMSNPPDRYEGFHSDGICCREKSDKGRNPDNMKTYTQDRRAYENWADGDYNLANRLMGEFQKDENLYECPKCHEMKRMTADHIGPISLGFCHSMYFAPLCTSCNSAKNNRFTYEDVQFLLKKEKEGFNVISWHAKYIWDLLKGMITDDISAKRASSLMSEYHQNVLFILSVIYKETGEDYLKRFLHPEFSLWDYRFENFHPFHLENLQVLRKPLESKNKRKNQERYIRVAFESLEEFLEKDNRRHEIHFEDGQPEIDEIIIAINDGDYMGADQCLDMVLNNFANDLVSKKWSA